MATRTASALVSLAVSLTACGGGGYEPVGNPQPAPPPVGVTCVDRAELCADQLLNGTTATLVNNGFYLPGTDSAAALHQFSGTLGITADSMSVSAGETTGRVFFPAIAVQYISVGDVLLPLERDVIRRGTAGAWDIILSPGKIWSESNDQGLSRASFPFTFVTNQWNEAHNGVATFLFDAVSVSNVQYQVTQETAVWNKADMWGITSASYSPEVIGNAAQIEQDFLNEVGARVEVKDWSAIGVDYPGADLSQFTRNIPATDISASGILVDNTLYFRAANTRFGAYPYPLEMRHGVFSVTKSAQAALTMLRLAQKYGEQVFDLFVTDYLNVTATHGGWNGVTFGHLLSMVAGIGDRFPDPNAQVTFADENDSSSQIWAAVWNSFARADKLAAAFRYGDYPWAPGQIVRYNTAHTFILGAAMHSFYEAMEGPNANVWQMMRDEVYGPIGIQALPTIQTVDDEPIPIYGFGLFLNAYDTARVSQLLSNDGVYNGQQILHRVRTRQSMYKTTDMGFNTYASVPIVGSSQNARYLNSFWSFELVGPSTCTARIPYMWGFGGNFVVILQNGISAFRYADGDVHDPAALALATTGIRSVC
ncbi:MAG: serine hydrolase [Woeseia sp.]